MIIEVGSKWGEAFALLRRGAGESSALEGILGKKECYIVARWAAADEVGRLNSKPRMSKA